MSRNRRARSNRRARRAAPDKRRQWRAESALGNKPKNDVKRAREARQAPLVLKKLKFAKSHNSREVCVITHHDAQTRFQR
jgi:hypothetical protein